MSETPNNPEFLEPQEVPETPPVEDARAGLSNQKKNALLRYMAVLFGVAFLLVLLSFLIQMRDSRETISDLSQSNASALQNAGKLQEETQALAEENAGLRTQLEEAVRAAAEAREAAETAAESQAQSDAALEELTQTALAYEQLIAAQRCFSGGDLAGCRQALTTLEPMKTHLAADSAAALYEELQAALKEAEEQQE